MRITRVHEGYFLEGYQFKCPGCNLLHVIPVRFSPEQKFRRGGQGDLWTFNGDVNRPTFSPSLLVTWDYGEPNEHHVCHSFIRDGKIEFLGDCTHPMAGKTVDLSEVT